jgi:hypothetical protein
VFLDVQKMGYIRRQDILQYVGNALIPVHVLFWRDRLEAARLVIIALRGVGRAGDDDLGLLAVLLSAGPPPGPGSRRRALRRVLSCRHRQPFFRDRGKGAAIALEGGFP